ncbi:MAG: hypothetical protein JWO06_2108 [Bacteroidota bacterium]|nr:hypothetical protein [Bacteroidota bacterium]
MYELFNKIEDGLLNLIFQLFLRPPKTVKCRSGGIGRRARLKLVCCKTCGFDSHLRYKEGFNIMLRPFFIPCFRK